MKWNKNKDSVFDKLIREKVIKQRNFRRKKTNSYLHVWISNGNFALRHFARVKKQGRWPSKKRTYLLFPYYFYADLHAAEYIGSRQRLFIMTDLPVFSLSFSWIRVILPVETSLKTPLAQGSFKNYLLRGLDLVGRCPKNIYFCPLLLQEKSTLR